MSNPADEGIEAARRDVAALSAQGRIDAVHAGFGGQVSELPQSGSPVDNLFVDLECYTVVGCSHVHTVTEAEECQDGRCPKAVESLLNREGA